MCWWGMRVARHPDRGALRINGKLARNNVDSLLERWENQLSAEGAIVQLVFLAKSRVGHSFPCFLIPSLTLLRGWILIRITGVVKINISILVGSSKTL
jgi:hypothetical protein